LIVGVLSSSQPAGGWHFEEWFSRSWSFISWAPNLCALAEDEDVWIEALPESYQCSLVWLGSPCHNFLVALPLCCMSLRLPQSFLG
jgi:hypothetical protein